MASIFSKIISGEIPCHKVAEDDKFLSFLDIRPFKKGHTLVIPKVEVDYIFDVDDSTLGDMMIFAKRVAKAIEKAIPCKRIGVTVIGLEVPHAHIHLVPLDKSTDMDITMAREMSHVELAEVAKLISAEFV